MQDLPILGFCRFSLVHTSILDSFASTRGLSLEEAETKIYAEDRMKLRFRLFEASCLPTFEALHRESEAALGIVLIGRRMPWVWKKRLRNLVDGRTGVKIRQMDETRNFRRDIRKIARGESGERAFFSYRVDDDDALSPLFVSDILGAASDLQPGAALTCVHGFMVGRYGKKVFRIRRRPYYPLNAQGLGVYSGPPQFSTVLDMGNHKKIAERVPEVREIAPPRWIRFVHASNDTGQPPIDAPDLSLEDTLAALNEWFPHITEHELLRLPIHATEAPGLDRPAARETPANPVDTIS